MGGDPGVPAGDPAGERHRGGEGSRRKSVRLCERSTSSAASCADGETPSSHDDRRAVADRRRAGARDHAPRGHDAERALGAAASRRCGRASEACASRRWRPGVGGDVRRVRGDRVVQVRDRSDADRLIAPVSARRAGVSERSPVGGELSDEVDGPTVRLSGLVGDDALDRQARGRPGRLLPRAGAGARDARSCGRLGRRGLLPGRAGGGWRVDRRRRVRLLGLGGTVGDDALRRVLAGEHPGTGELLGRQRAGSGAGLRSDVLGAEERERAVRGRRRPDAWCDPARARPAPSRMRSAMWSGMPR